MDTHLSDPHVLSDQIPSLPIIGRHVEREILDKVRKSKKPEFVAIYGRRRIGKTHLIRETFRNTSDLFFSVTGQQKGNQATQLTSFREGIEKLRYCSS